MQALQYVMSYFRPTFETINTPYKGPKPPPKTLPHHNTLPTRRKGRRRQWPPEPPSNHEIIFKSMKIQPIVKVWGFVFVRCTYKSEERWKAFLSTMKEKALNGVDLQQHETVENSPEEIEFLKETLRMTTIEDEEKLDGASMLDASITFQEWTKGEGNVVKKDGSAYRVPRWQYYVYVNEESIESVLNPVRAKELTGNFVVMVHAASSIRGEKDDENDPYATYQPEEIGDTSFKLLAAGALVLHYIYYAEDMNMWHAPGEWDGPPHVQNSGRYSSISGWWWADILKEDDEGGTIGLDVYLMLKQIYGVGHYRSPCFVADAAQTRAQRLRGYDGGFNFRIP